MEKKIRVIIADDQAIFSEGLKSLLDAKDNIEVVAMAFNGREAVEKAARHCPDVVIMDILMPDLNGVEATENIVKNTPGVRVIALSQHSTKKMIDKMFGVGAVGYILKESTFFDEIYHAIYEVTHGRHYLSPKIRRMYDHGTDGFYFSQEKKRSHLLSKKEREVLQLVAEGLKTRHIAEKHHISVKTVETHRRNIMKKLDLYSVAELTKFALREGMTPP